jgi:hypothetical protein
MNQAETIAHITEKRDEWLAMAKARSERMIVIAPHLWRLQDVGDIQRFIIASEVLDDLLEVITSEG